MKNIFFLWSYSSVIESTCWPVNLCKSFFFIGWEERGDLENEMELSISLVLISLLTCCLLIALWLCDPGCATAPPSIDNRSWDDKALFRFFWKEAIFITRAHLHPHRKVSNQRVGIRFPRLNPASIQKLSKCRQHGNDHSTHQNIEYSSHFRQIQTRRWAIYSNAGIALAPVVPPLILQFLQLSALLEC